MCITPKTLTVNGTGPATERIGTDAHPVSEPAMANAILVAALGGSRHAAGFCDVGFEAAPPMNTASAFPRSVSSWRAE